MKKLFTLAFAALISSSIFSQVSPATYTTAGNYTFTVPAGIGSVTIEVVGAGGSGGGNGTGGGGGGGYAKGVYTVVAGSTLAVKVGSAGAGPAVGTSSVGGFISATGGANGVSVPNPGVGGGGTGGAGSGGTIVNRTGGNGGGGYYTYFGGGGGGAGGPISNGFNGGNTPVYNGTNCLTPGGAAGPGGGPPGGSGGKGAGFIDGSCNNPDPSMPGGTFGGGGGGGNGNGYPGQAGAVGYVEISWGNCSAPAAPTNTTLPQNLTICANKTTTLSAIGSGTVNWYTSPSGTTVVGSGTNFTTPTLTNSITYYAGVTNSCSPSATRTAISITVNAVPSITVTPFTGSVCAGGSIILTANGANSYTWNIGPNTTTISVTPSVTTNYSVSGTGANGCTNTAVRIVTVYPVPSLTIVTSSSLICAGDVVTFTASGAANYNWNPAGTGATISVSPTVTTTYTLTGTTAAGCTNTKTITQNVSPCVGLAEVGFKSSGFEVYPNPFGDKINLISDQAKNYSVEVYNSVGKLISYFQISGTRSEIDLHESTAGIYFIRVYSGSGSSIKKIIKE